MFDAIWLDRLSWLFGGDSPNVTTGEVMVRGMLLGCSLFATVQLFSMLGTRWGDRNPMAKSFVLSLLIHVCLGLGWQTIALEAARWAPQGTDEVSASSPEPLTSISIENVSTDRRLPDDSGAAFVDRTMPPIERTVDRSTPPPVEIEPDSPLEKMVVDDPFNTAEPLPLMATSADDPDASPTPAASVPAIERTAAAITEPAPELARDTRPEPRPVTNIRRRSPAGTQLAPLTPIDEPAPPRTGAATADNSSRKADIRTPSPTADDPAVSPRQDAPRTISGAPDRRLPPSASPAPASDVVDPTATASSGAPSPKVASAAPFQRRRSTPSAAGTSTGAEEFGPAPPLSPSRNGANRNSDDLVAAKIPSRGGSGAGRDLGAGEFDEPGAPPTARSANPGNAVRGPLKVPETYRLRKLRQRKEAAIRFGGSEATERAVELSLKFLSTMQEADGRWDCTTHGGGADDRTYTDSSKPYDRKKDGVNADTGVTALGILAFLGAGYTHEEGTYAETVDRALRYLIKKQRSDGYLGGDALDRDAMYCHAIATYALAEANGMRTDPTSFPALKTAVGRAAAFSCLAQYSDGGWRYQQDGRKGQQGDMSVFGWHLMSIKSAELAGLDVPESTRSGIVDFLKRNSVGEHGGLAAYRLGQDPTPAMTAEALFCKQMMGIKRNNLASQEAIDHLRKHLPRASQPNDYYWYYGTLAMFQYGGEPWEEWNASMRELLVSTQRTSGQLAGSWDPQDPWGRIGGRVYSTAMPTLCLEVYYRFLPIYRINDVSTDDE